MQGPVEFLLLEFDDRPLPPDLVLALIELSESEAIRVLDILVIGRNSAGEVYSVEIDDLDDDVRELFYELEGEYDGLISERDVELIAEAMSPDESAVAIVWRDLWAARFATSVAAANGSVLVHERLTGPSAELILAADAASAG
ncbi:MAG: hypothetical protein JWO63_918 [Frankiales bacterium]|jgi:hypothetical protein|nr:hypothetical protein [Frankiales bacterium]